MLFGIFKRKENEMYHEIIDCLVSALEAKDVYTGGHSARVADMSYDLSKALGIKGKELEYIHIAAHLHDVGKIGIPDRVLNKEGKLLPHEWEQIKNHPQIGYEILSKSKKLKNIAKIVLSHHERWDGKGYPNGLKQEGIPLGARIIGLCDAIDAMTSKRSYRDAMSWEICKTEILNNKAIQFDPILVEKAEEIWNHWSKDKIASKNT